MCKRITIALALLSVGFIAGTLRPHARALDDAERLVRELAGIRGELAQIRRALERR